jgi:phosphatidate cytidylyltransferase
VRPGGFRVRALLVLVGLPLFFVLIFLLPQYKHLGLNLVALAATSLGALELEALLAARGTPRLRVLAVLSALVPAAAYLEILGLARPWWSQAALAALVCAGLLGVVPVRGQEGLNPLLQKAAASVLLVIYPAVFVSYVVRMSGLPEPSLVLLLFFALNFGNDIMAYLAGTFLGARTRLGLLISPNKSAAGFAAGLATSVAVALLYRWVFPRAIPLPWVGTAALGLGVGVLSIGGDLVESALKRSAGVKDSGGIIPGRGGLLDSMDSLLLSAPLYYFVLLGVSGYISP